MHASILLVAAALLLADPSPNGIRVESALVTLIDQADVPAREAGVLVQFTAREGDSVKRDDLLARIDDSQAALAARHAQTELDIAQKESRNETKLLYASKTVDVAKAELKRSNESVEKYKKSISETELDRLRLTVEQAELQVQESEHELGVAKLNERLKADELATAQLGVERRRITAPFAGVVVEVKRRLGEWVEPGTPVVRIVRIDRLRVEGFIRAEDLQGELVGRPARLKVDLPGKPGSEFVGAVVFVSPEVDPVNGQARVWAEVENPDGLLRPGLRASLTIAPRGNSASVQSGDSR